MGSSEQPVHIYAKDPQTGETHEPYAIVRVGWQWLRTLGWNAEDVLTWTVDRPKEGQPRLILQRTYRPPKKESKETNKNDRPR